MTEYKSTLNLPVTQFPMRASLAEREPKWLELWEQESIYQSIRDAREGCPVFVLHDGPPYANGNLHCGHALNKILKDIIVKSKTLSGFNAPFIPGWDCHGLPIELNVEKKTGKPGRKISASDFRNHCRQYASSQIEIQKNEFRRLGVLADWQNPYVTMDFKYEADIVRALGKIIKNDHLQQGFKPVHWCIDCGSSLAEAEVDYENKVSDSIDVAFCAVDAGAVYKSFGLTDVDSPKPVIIPIWTTTPWTLPANEAVCLHEKIEYVLLESADCCYVLAKDCVDATMARYGLDYVIKAEVLGRELENIVLQHPFEDRKVPLVLGEHVTVESGTGCVHTAPTHGPDDYIVGQKYKLPMKNKVMTNGCFNDDVEQLAGVFISKANPVIIELLKNNSNLLHQETISHSYPHCWRHKSPVIFLATPQWFIAMDKNGLREQLLQVIESVNWLPDWGKARIRLMILNRPDWCISRQRTWGTPMPLFIHKKTRALHPDTLEIIEAAAQKIESIGIDAWFDSNPSDFLSEQDVEEYDKVSDTLDVWFDSGVSHFCVLNRRELHSIPADIYFEGSDQYRGWFNSSITTAVAMYGKSPYKTSITHGYTVDAEGKKLSKSKGNYVALDALIGKYGADILRLWVASGDYKNEVSISEEIIKRNADAYRRIRNTSRFLLANLFDFDPKKDCVPVEQMLELDRFAIARAKILQMEIIEAYENYQFHVIYQKIHNFCAVDMGSFYLDLIKDRQYTTQKDSIPRRSCQTAMFYIIHALSRWLAPILSFTANEIWSEIPGTDENAKNIFTTFWYKDWPDGLHVDTVKWHHLMQIRDEVNKALEIERANGLIGSGLAASVILYVKPKWAVLLESLESELRFLLITSEAKVLPEDNLSTQQNLHKGEYASIKVLASEHEKCGRCWHRCEDVGSNNTHPTLCRRCIENVDGSGEVRLYI